MASSFSPINQTLWFVTIQCFHTETYLKSFIISPRSRQSVFCQHTSLSVLWHYLKFCLSTLRHTQPVVHHPPVFQGFDKLKCVGPTDINMLTIYSHLVSLLWHYVNCFFVPVSNKPSSFVLFCFVFPHLVLVFSTTKLFLEPLCPSEFKHSQYSQSVLQWCHMLQVLSSFTPYQVHSVVYKYPMI